MAGSKVEGVNQSTTPQPQPLADVVRKVKGWVERCGWVWVEGQIIELNRRPGRQFFTLRDRNEEISARLSCPAHVLDAAGPLAVNSQVVAEIHPVVWHKNTSLSFECRQIKIVGEGQLLAQLEALKHKLQAEGLFDEIRKKKLPFLPGCIGLITGAESAAQRDVLRNVEMRWPGARFKVINTLVQGPQAAEQVIEALKQLDADPDVEVIIIARGGGSLEDLLPFSDEGLVRAAAAARTPLISAIGHEPDTPILDLVADVRASTPTAAAKMVVPVAADELASLEQTLLRTRAAMLNRLAFEQKTLSALISRPVLRDPSATISAHADKVAELNRRLTHAAALKIREESAFVANSLARIQAMSPKATLERGYAIVSDADNISVTSVNDVEPGDQLQIYLSDGQLYAEVDYQEDE